LISINCAVRLADTVPCENRKEPAMPSTGHPTFDKTLQESNLWLKELMKVLKTNDRELAFRVLRATLHALRDRIGPHNAVHFGAQLPMLLRGMYYEGFRLEESTTAERHTPAFLDHVRSELPADLAIGLEDAVKGVFWVVSDKIDRREVAKIANLFPKEMRELLPPADVLG
jgi:uncharacterized protein (DUF2267 family)